MLFVNRKPNTYIYTHREKEESWNVGEFKNSEFVVQYVYNIWSLYTRFFLFSPLWFNEP